MNPSISKKNWTVHDTLKLIELQHLHASRWSLIALEFSQRSPTFLKNTFFLMMRKVLRKLAKQSTHLINAGDLKTLQPRVLTEFLWSDLELEGLGCGPQYAGYRVVDLFRAVIEGEMAEVQKSFRGLTQRIIDAVFHRLNEMK